MINACTRLIWLTVCMQDTFTRARTRVYCIVVYKSTVSGHIVGQNVNIIIVSTSIVFSRHLIVNVQILTLCFHYLKNHTLQPESIVNFI